MLLIFKQEKALKAMSEHFNYVSEEVVSFLLQPNNLMPQFFKHNCVQSLRAINISESSNCNKFIVPYNSILSWYIGQSSLYNKYNKNLISNKQATA